MNGENSDHQYEEGIPDKEMPELSENHFAKAKSNRFAKNMFQLDEDVARYFKTPKEVNEALRLVIRLSQLIPHKL